MDTSDSPVTPNAGAQYTTELAAKAALVAGATGLRMSMRWIEIASEHGASLMKLASEAAADSDEGEHARSAFREELLTVAREVAEATSQETRRGVDDLDMMSRDDATTEDATRPWKYKE